MDPGLIDIAEQGARLSLMDYLAAVKEREALGVAMNVLHRKWDLLLTPTIPHPRLQGRRRSAAGSGQTRWPDWTPFTYPFNLTRQPAATVPCGFTKAGLPVGLQIVGPMYADAKVLQAARAYELVAPFKMPAL